MLNRRRFIAGASVLPFVGSGAAAQIVRPGLSRGRAGSFGYYNLGLDYLPRWTVKLAQVRAGTGRARLMCHGDSTTRGTGAGTGANFNIDADQVAYPKKLADYIASQGVPAIFNSANSGTFGSGGKDSRVTLGSDWINTGAASFGGQCYQYDGTGTTALSFTPLFVFDRLRVGYLRQSSSDTFTVDVDGGAALATINADGGSSFQTSADLTVTRGLHTINITPTDVAGVLRVVWVEVWDSTIPAVDVFNVGWSGATASDLDDATAVQNLSGITKFAPDLSIIMMGINDQTAGTSESSFKTSMQAVIDIARVSGDIILCSGTPSNTTGGEGGRQTYARYMRDLAELYGFPFVDVVELMGTDANATAQGWKPPGNALHINAAGYAVLAPFIGRAVLGG
jgi:lysophospholipase L1-like esterase